MDPFAHTFMGASLAASGLRKYTPLATAALVIGANAPDIDIAVLVMGDYSDLAHRRGWTHGVLAWVVLPFLVTGLLLLWDRIVRRRKQPEQPPVQLRWLLLLSAVGVLSHPALDWLNNYGIRLLMPFDGRWFYGDALFIIDPWVWLALGGVTFLCWSHSKLSWLLWGILILLASRLIVSVDLVPPIAKLLWFFALILLLFIRIRFGVCSGSKAPLAMLTIAICYMSANILASDWAEERLRSRLHLAGHGVIEQVMVAPTPANPFHFHVVAVTHDHYLFGHWRWLKKDTLELEADSQPRNIDDPVVRAAAKNLAAQRYLSWSRFPYAAVKQTKTGYQVSFLDARYRFFDGGILGPRVSLNADLTIASVESLW